MTIGVVLSETQKQIEKEKLRYLRSKVRREEDGEDGEDMQQPETNEIRVPKKKILEIRSKSYLMNNIYRQALQSINNDKDMAAAV